MPKEVLRQSEEPPVPSLNSTSKNFSLSGSAPSRSWKERSVFFFLVLAALVSVFTTLGIVIFFLREVSGFFSEVSWKDFFFGLEWYPLLEPRRFGILPLISGTFMVAVGACVVAIPLGLLSAIFLSEYVAPYPRTLMKSCLEVLAGVPTVVYGYLALTFITPQLQKIFPSLEIFNALSAAIVVGIMIVPTISSITQDAFEAVPAHLREAAYGLGGRKYQVALTVVLPAAFSGFMASVILAFSRALGETMAVTLAAGATPKLTLNFFESIQTMTAYIVQVSLGDTPAGTIEYQSIFAVGMVLFAMTFLTNVAAQFFVRRIHERY